MTRCCTMFVLCFFLNGIVFSQENEKQELKRKILDLQKKVEELKADNDKLKVDNDKLKDRIEQLEKLNGKVCTCGKNKNVNRDHKRSSLVLVFVTNELMEPKNRVLFLETIKAKWVKDKKCVEYRGIESFYLNIAKHLGQTVLTVNIVQFYGEYEMNARLSKVITIDEEYLEEPIGRRSWRARGIQTADSLVSSIKSADLVLPKEKK